MLEIPGEEAPTDPGLQARLKKEAEDKVRQKAQRTRNRIIGAVLALLFLGAIGGGVLMWHERQQALVYDVEDYYALPLEDLAVAGPTPVADNSAPTAAPEKNPRKTPRNGTTNGGTPIQTPTSSTDVSHRGSESGPSSDMSLGTGPAQTGSVSLTSSTVKVERFGADVVLTDDAEIFDMAKRVLSAYAPQVQNCYVQRLKQKEGLAGVWNVNFVITTEGTARAVTVKGLNTADPELEQCIQRTVSAWKFQKISKERPLSKPYRFGPAGW